ncbi:MAG: asparaginase [Cytophagales bacterium]|nr:asparaginase [Rhizobacter sp.]
MQNIIVVLGTGGTIAGTSAVAGDDIGYTAAQIGVAQLVKAMPALAGVPLECEQVAQIDSKDMGFAVWRALALRASHHLARPEVAGVVVTHGTDTLEETAYFLQRVLAPNKPLVMTAAMRPATSPQADGPQNLLDAVRVAGHTAVHGVVVVLNGHVHCAHDVRKTHTYRMDAFSSGDAGVVGMVSNGQVRVLRARPQGVAVGIEILPVDEAAWPRVEIVHSHAGVDGTLVRLLCTAGVRGLVVAATGNGTVHHALEAALVLAQAQGVKVLRSSRCLGGRVLPRADELLPSADDLTPVKARIELLLELLKPPSA